jgi:hypothetical protein
MGGCFGKAGKKVSPHSSNGHFINGEIHSRSYDNSATNILGIETTKHTSDEGDINSAVHAKNHDKITEVKKIRSENSKNTSIDNTTHGPPVHKPSNFQVPPQGRDGLPTKAVRFDIDFNNMGTPRKFPRRLKVINFCIPA